MNLQQSNYQSNSNHPINEYKRKRRARDQATERNYICACGKTYLSYPALYTHIKNKHQGKAPNPQDIASMPPVSHTRSLMVTREQPQNEYEKHISTPDQVLVSVINTFRPYATTKQLNYTIDQIFGVFPTELKKQIQEAVKHCLKQKVQVQKILDNGIKAVTIDAIMGRFISLLANKIDRNLIVEFIFILLLFRKNLNDYFAKNQATTGEYTKAASGMKMLDNINQFTLYGIDIYAHPYAGLIQDSYFIGKKNREFICVSKFMFLFGRWVFLDRYTNSKIKLNNY